jgi:predicted kinase
MIQRGSNKLEGDMVIVVFGLPGTGKTFFSEKLAEKTGAVHLNTDIIRIKMGKKGVYDEQTKNLIYANMLEQAADYLGNGRDVILDGTFLRQEQRKQVHEIAKAKRQQIFFIEILADEKVVEERLKEKRKFSEADLEIYRKLKKEHEPFTGNRLMIWTDREDLEIMLMKAEKYIYG